MEIHQPDTGHPALAFRREADRRFAITTSDSTKNVRRYRAALSEDSVHDIVYRFTLDPKDGQADVWVDGAQILSIAGVPMGISQSGCYACYGLYYGGIADGVAIVSEYGNIAFPGPDDLSGRIGSPPAW